MDDPLVSVVIPTYNRKSKLVRLIDSVTKSNYPKDKLEIIVVDDASTDGTDKDIKIIFPQIIVIRNEYEKLLAATRNIGIKYSNGDFIFLIDDDNVINSDTITNLIIEINKNPSVGIIAPIMYYFRDKKRIWCAGIERNIFTSKTKFIGRDQIDNGQFNDVVKSKDFPNAFLVRKDVFRKIGLFDDVNFLIHYDEADFGERARRVGYNIVCDPRSKIWHDMPLEKTDILRFYNINNEIRTYYTAKNRILFHRKYSNWWEFLIFILVFNWLIFSYYMKIIFINSNVKFDIKKKIAISYMKGTIGGITEIK